MLNTLNIVAAESEVNTLLVGPSNEEIKAITLFASFQSVGTRGNFKLNLELFIISRWFHHVSEIGCTTSIHSYSRGQSRNQ